MKPSFSPSLQFWLLAGTLEDKTFRSETFEQLNALRTMSDFEPSYEQEGQSLIFRLTECFYQSDPRLAQQHAMFEELVRGLVDEQGLDLWQTAEGKEKPNPDLFIKALQYRSDFLVKLLLKHLPEHFDDWGALLDGAAEQGGAALLIRAGLNAGMPAQTVDASGRTALYYVRDEESIGLLLEKGLDPAHLDDQNQTAYTYRLTAGFVVDQSDRNLWKKLGVAKASGSWIAQMIAAEWETDLAPVLPLQKRGAWRWKPQDHDRSFTEVDVLVNNLIDNYSRTFFSKDLSSLIGALKRSRNLPERTRGLVELFLRGQPALTRQTLKAEANFDPDIVLSSKLMADVARDCLYLESIPPLRNVVRPSFLPRPLLDSLSPSLCSAALEGCEVWLENQKTGWNQATGWALDSGHFPNAEGYEKDNIRPDPTMMAALTPRARAIIWGVGVASSAQLVKQKRKGEVEHLQQTAIPMLIRALSEAGLDGPWAGLMKSLSEIPGDWDKALLAQWREHQTKMNAQKSRRQRSRHS